MNTKSVVSLVLNTCAIAAFSLLLSACGGGGGSSGGGGGNGSSSEKSKAASSSPVSYTVTAAAGAGGSISPDSRSVISGQTTSFTLTPNANYSVSNVSGCGGTLEGNVYTTGVITQACNVEATFAPISYQLTTKIEGSGSLAPATQSVRHGEQARFTISAGDGFSFSFAQGCDGYVDYENNVFIIPSVTKACELQASFHNAANVHFIDGNLEQKIRESLGITHNQPLLVSELEQLQTLLASFAGIKRLDGLEKAKNLKTLMMDFNQVSNLSPLANLPLTTLDISSNPVTNAQLPFLKAMPLQNLYLQLTQVSDLSPLANKHLLVNLSIAYTQISDLTPLTGLSELRWLYAPYISAVDISPLLHPGLNKLSIVNISGCLKTTGFSRAQQVIEQLKQRGGSVFLGNPMEWAGQKCPKTESINNIALSGSLNNGELELNWQISATDTGPWSCEIHFNLDNQQPRLPANVIENCHEKSSIRLSGLNLYEYEPTLVVDTGLYNDRKISAPLTVASSSKPQTAILQSYDWVQTLVKTNPLLVMGKTGTLRLHVTAQTSVAVPNVQVFAELNGQRESIPVTAPTQIPQKKSQSDRTHSYYSQIPARLMQPGVTIEASLNGATQLRLEPAFAKVHGINLTLIPIQLGDEITTLPSDQQVRDSLTRFWPLGDINITRRAPYKLSKPADQINSNAILEEVNDLRIVENGSDYYYGYFEQKFNNNDFFVGVGYSPGMVAVGITKPSGIDTILAHELGHNFSLRHAPCGTFASVDRDYPYQEGITGSYSADLAYTAIYGPQLKDLMGYCNGEQVSDYNYEKAQDYLERQTNQPAIIRTGNTAPLVKTHKIAQTSATRQNSFYIRVNVDSTGARIAQQIALPHLPSLSKTDGYRVKVHFADGSQQQLPVMRLDVDHRPEAGSYQLQFALPTDSPKPLRFVLEAGQHVLLEHVLTIQSTTSADDQVTKVMSKPDGKGSANSRLYYRNNEVCVTRDDGTTRHANLLWHHTDGVIALALNETATRFCRALGDVPTGEAELQEF